MIEGGEGKTLLRVTRFARSLVFAPRELTPVDIRMAVGAPLEFLHIEYLNYLAAPAGSDRHMTELASNLSVKSFQRKSSDCVIEILRGTRAPPVRRVAAFARLSKSPLVGIAMT